MVLDNAYAHGVSGGKGKPSMESLESCSTRLHYLVHKYRPRVICPFGAYAIAAFGIPGKITTICGEVYRYGYAGNSGVGWLVPCVHPAHVLRKNSSGWQMQMAMQKVGNLVTAEGKYHNDATISYPERFDSASNSFWCDHLTRAANIPCAVDLETTGTNPKSDKVVCISITYEWKGQLRTAWNTDCDMRQIKSWFTRGPRIIQGAKFELSWIRPKGRPEYHDTFLRAGFINENEAHNLDHLSVRYAGAWPYWADLVPYEDWADLLIPLDSTRNEREVLLKSIGDYCALDTTFTYRLWQWQETKLTDENKDFLAKVVNPLAYILLEMEDAGIKIDTKELNKLEEETLTRIAELEAKLGKSFPGVNFNSSKQVQTLLFDKEEDGGMGLEPIELTKTGAPSAKKEVIIQLAKKHRKLQPVAEYRSLTSKVGRIINVFKEQRDGLGLLHTNFNQGFVVTGRLSSSGPNVQNIERNGTEKRCIVSRFPRGKLIKADYGQFELRISAIQARDRAFKIAIQKGVDLHTDTADKLKVERQVAKTINLSMASGTSAMGMHHNEGLPIGKCRRFHTEWFKQHPDIKRFHQKLVRDVTTKHYVTNLFGRRRHLPDSYDKSEKTQRRAANQAKNFPIQGGGADIIAAAMVKIDHEIRRRGMKSILILQIHDEVVVDCPANEVKEMKKIVEDCMMHPFDKPFYLPLAVDIDVGRSLAKTA